MSRSAINKIAVANTFAEQGEIRKLTNKEVDTYFKNHSLTNKHGTWTDLAPGELEQVEEEAHEFNTGLVKKQTSIKNYKYGKTIANLTEEQKQELIKKNISQMKTTMHVIDALNTLHEDVCEAEKEYSKEVDSHVCHGKHGSWWDGTSSSTMKEVKDAIWNKMRGKSRNKYLVE